MSFIKILCLILRIRMLRMILRISDMLESGATSFIFVLLFKLIHFLIPYLKIVCLNLIWYFPEVHIALLLICNVTLIFKTLHNFQILLILFYLVRKHLLLSCISRCSWFMNHHWWTCVLLWRNMITLVMLLPLLTRWGHFHQRVA